MSEKNPLCELYEKLYFHEIDVREHLSARLQLPLALIVSMIGALAYMLRNFDKDAAHNFPAYLFIFLLIASTEFLIVSVIYFVRSCYGHTYEFLPCAEESDKYRKQLLETYKDWENGEDLSITYLKDYICNYFIKCSTVNTRCNDKRSLYLHKTNKHLIISVAFAGMSFLAFHFADLDKEQKNKFVQVKIMHPVEIKDIK